MDGKQHTSAFWLEEDPLAAETQAQPAPSTSPAPPAAAPKPKRSYFTSLCHAISKNSRLLMTTVASQALFSVIRACTDL